MQSKGEEGQRHDVMVRSLQLASQRGLEALSIGDLAAHLKMSRSGLFYYVGAREKFQLELIDFAAELFRRTLVDPVLLIPAPLERIRRFLTTWPGWTARSDPALPGPCPFVSFLFELEGTAGPLRDRILWQIDRLDEFLVFLFRSAVAARDFAETHGAEEFVQDCWAFYLPLVWRRQRRRAPPDAKELASLIEALIRKHRHTGPRRSRQ